MATAFKDYYQALGVARTATDKEIKAAFRKAARKSHPDLHPGDAGAEARFKEINEAHEVLADPEKRRKYDQFGADWEHGPQARNPFGAGMGGNGQRVEYRTMSATDLEGMFGSANPFSEFFHSMFGSAGRPGNAPGEGPRGAARPQQLRGSDVEGAVEITLDEAANGTSRTVAVESDGKSRRVEVKIPPGIADGARVRAAGQGSGGGGGGARGDLYIRVRILPHALFERLGDDLRARVPVPLDVALLGGSVEVPIIRGKRVSLTIPPETQNGTPMRLRGLGMPRLQGKGSGDLHVEVSVALPLPLTPAAKALAEGLREGS
ncbi:MAG: DnaJ C-terminal domain-containing protein [Candidatus Dormibacteria bacterium]